MKRAYGVSDKNPAHAYAQGTGGVGDYNAGMRHAYGNNGDGIEAEQERKRESYNTGMLHAYGVDKPKISDLTARSMLMRDNPEVAYGIGNSVGVGAHPENAAGIGTGGTEKERRIAEVSEEKKLINPPKEYTREYKLEIARDAIDSYSQLNQRADELAIIPGISAQGISDEIDIMREDIFKETGITLEQAIENVQKFSGEVYDYSSELNGAIMKACDEFVPNVLNANKPLKAVNFGIWANGAYNHWNFVADGVWNDTTGYIPISLQREVPSKNEAYFVVNGHEMNREQYGNYVKGATAQYAGIDPAVVSAGGLADSAYNNLIEHPEDYSWNWDNEWDDTYYTYLGAQDMLNGIIK